MIRFALILVCALILPTTVQSVQPYTPKLADPLLEPWRWTSFPELKGKGVQCLAEDNDGRMWFGIKDGALVYDGLTWTPHTDVDGLIGSVFHLRAAADGGIYAGTSFGVFKHQNGAWLCLFPEEGGSPWPVTALREVSDGSLWVGGKMGALRLNRGDATLYTVPFWVSSSRVLYSGITIATLPEDITATRRPVEGVGIAILARPFPQIIRYVFPGSPAASAGLQVGDQIVAVDGSSGQFKLSMPGPSVTVKVRRSGKGEPSTVVMNRRRSTDSYPVIGLDDVVEGSDGALWFGLEDGSILRHERYDSRPGKDNRWQLYSGDTGPRASATRTGVRQRLLESRSGDLWSVARDANRHVWRLVDGHWQETRLRDLGGENLNPCILETSDGTIWVGGHSGVLHAFRDGVWKVYRRPAIQTPANYIVDMIEASDGALWVVGQGQEAVRIDLGSARWVTYEGLYFQCDSEVGDEWFTTRDGGIVRHTSGQHRYNGRLSVRTQTEVPQGQWLRYGAEDGVMTIPLGVLVTASGAVWAWGSHGSTKQNFDPEVSVAATARLISERWVLQTHPELSHAIFPPGGYESSDGSVWFGAGVDGVKFGVRSGGVLRFDGQEWTHFIPPDAPPVVYGIAETGSGDIWFCGDCLLRFSGAEWSDVAGPDGLSDPFSMVLEPGLLGDVWVGHRLYGVFHYDQGKWTGYDITDRLPDNNIRGIAAMPDGTVWANTAEGFARFDGHSWTRDILPRELASMDPDGIHPSREGALWIRDVSDAWGPQAARARFRSVRYRGDIQPPITAISLGLDQVSQPGNTTVAWMGADLWRDTPEDMMQFSWRLDSEPWSPFTHNRSHIFQALGSGEHTFEVKARDRDFNEDPTPASLVFTVVSPVWKQAWFIGMVTVFLVGIAAQTTRVVRRDRRLRESNSALSDANNELYSVNINLQREQVLERLRGQAQGMASSDDIGAVVEAVRLELKDLGLPIRQVGIGIYQSETSARNWTTNLAGDAFEPHIVEVNATHYAVIARARGEAFCHRHWEGEAFRKMIRKTIEEGQPWLRGVPEEDWPDGIESYFVFFEGGFVALGTTTLIDEKDLMLLKRFGEVFAFAHARGEELEQKEIQNHRLAVDASVQRLRAEVQAMDDASDFERILSLLTASLKTVGLDFDSCEIDVLVESGESPTMALFESTGFNYITYTLAQDGHVSAESFGVASPFPAVIRQTIERFVAGEPWHAVIEDDTPVLEVPAGLYGRLRLTASGRKRFADEEVATLREFADAVATGYARYLDIREIQENTERKAAFLAGMSHELRTPMNAIKGFTRMVLKRAGDVLPERQKENLEKVDQASDHLLAMINDLLDLSKIESGRMDVTASTFDVRRLVVSTCGTVQPLVKDGVEVVVEADEVGEARTDEGRVRQMLLNLLSNALKYTESGSVTVKARRSKGAYGVPGSGNQEPGYKEEQDHLILSVRDTGKGIPVEEIPTLFDEYRQVKDSDREHKGTGLGLSITKRFAELLGGSVSVESAVGKGSTFTLVIPSQFVADTEAT